ncbi:PREDICTED: uncharacterized protein LOC107347631 [Acropora digitifera]|uniref:uncharacterized protein LOC107347631 n=1 Tax=Acropora digitifera TaxID=70779 RepID=UPI00077AC761|nr:PREDICTED: uncharacterized protein LOC107347631 [Acropora digitifera]
MLFPEIVRGKFKQVFLFVCGILGEEANIVFEWIGNMLQKQWDWSKCDYFTAKFFVDSWKETGNAKRMAKTLCSFLPFPRLLHVWDVLQWITVLKVLFCVLCVEFPEELAVAEVHLSPRMLLSFHFPDRFKPPDSISFIFYGCIFHESSYKVLKNSCAEKLTFALDATVGKGVSKLPDFGFSSVHLRICGSLGSSSLQDVEKLLLHKCLCSLSITVIGDVQEALVEALARGLEGESAVKFLDLCVNGNFSVRGAYLLEKGILRNRSLTNIKISVNGEPPENWQAVAKNLRAPFAERAIVSEIYPNIFKKVKDSQVTHLNRFLSQTDLKQQTVTLNVWGELSGEGCKAVCDVLLLTPVSHLTLNIHGHLTDEMLRYIARCVQEQEKLSPITINAWVEMTEKENKLIKELGLDKNPLFSLNVRGTNAPLKESSDSKVVSSDEPQSLIALFEKATKGPYKFTEDTSQKSLTIEVNDDKSDEWEHSLGERLVGSTSLKSLRLEIYKYREDNDEWGRGLGEGLARNTSLESLTIKIIKDNHGSSKWEHGLREGLARNTSLKALTLEIYDCGNENYDWGHGLGEGLTRNTSLESLTIKISKDYQRNSKWEHCLDEGLARNTSLKSLTLEIFCFCIDDAELGRSLGKGLARNTSLDSLTIKIINSHRNRKWQHGLGEGLAGNTSLKSLTLEIDDFVEHDAKCESDDSDEDDHFDKCGRGLGEGLARNTSLESLTLTINCNHGGCNEWRHPLGEHLAENNSLNSLTLTINNCCYMSDQWGVGLAEGLAGNTSLKSITLTINNYFYMSSVWGLGLFEGSARNTSLKSITLSINNYGVMKGERRDDLIEGLARNSSLTSMTLAINNYGGMEGEWGHCLFEGLARNTSLNSLTLTANNYGDMSEEGGCALRESLRKRESFTEYDVIASVVNADLYQDYGSRSN